MRFLKWWLVLAVLCLAGVLGSSDELRRVVRITGSEGSGWGSAPSIFADGQSETWEAAFRLGGREGDWRLVWGAAESALYPKNALVLFQRAAELNPRSREVLSHRAMLAASLLKMDRKETNFGWYKGTKPGKGEGVPDRKKVEAALQALREAERLDPGNSLLECVEAYVLFAAHRDEEGMDAMRRAEGLHVWEAYTLDGMRVATKWQWTGGWPRGTAAALGAMSDGPTRDADIYALHHLVLFLAGWGRGFEAQGEHRQAIERYRLAFLVGERMHANAETSSEVMFAVGCARRAIGMWRADSDALGPLGYAGSWPDSDWLNSLVANELRLERFCSYLSAHGEGEFAMHARAEWIGLEAEARELAAKRGDNAWARPPMSDVWALTTVASVQGLGVGGWALALALIVLLSWLADRLLRRSVSGGRRVACWVTLGLVIAFGLWRIFRFAPPRAWWAVGPGPAWSWVIIPSGVGAVALLLIICAIWAVVSRRRRACARGWRWFLLHWLGNVNITSLWAIAILLTIFLLLFIPIAIYGARIEHYYQEVLAKGEIVVLLGR